MTVYRCLLQGLRASVRFQIAHVVLSNSLSVPHLLFQSFYPYLPLLCSPPSSPALFLFPCLVLSSPLFFILASSLLPSSVSSCMSPCSILFSSSLPHRIGSDLTLSFTANIYTDGRRSQV